MAIFENQKKLATYLAESKASGFSDAVFANYMDSIDPLKNLRDDFVIPKIKDVVPNGDDSQVRQNGEEDCIYFSGNSTGIMPKRSKVFIEHEVQTWSESGVKSWFSKKQGVPWVEMEELVVDELAKIVGAKPIEVTASATLTVNLHTLLTAFYKPTASRNKILLEAGAFPSDHYAIESHIRFHGYDTKSSMVCMNPRDGEHTLRTEDICEYIQTNGTQVAVVLFPGVQYYTGQLFDMERITTVSKEQGCTVGWDLGHAIGNVPLKLRDWDVDFAVWCTYKYLNSGPGGIGGLFVSEKLKNYGTSIDYNYCNRLGGWWAGDLERRFLMENEFIPREGAAGFKQSTTSVLLMASLLGSLEVFAKTDMSQIRAKSELLTGYLEILLQEDAILSKYINILTPANPAERGAQLSLKVPHEHLTAIGEGLESRGVVFDERKPDCVRVAPAPLYNQFKDVLGFVLILKEVLQTLD